MGRMATFQIANSSWTLTARRDYIDVTMGWTYTPNESWTYTDKQGHSHHYDRGYPTLDLVIDAEHWCDGSEGFSRHDGHMAVDESHYECKVCREVIEPRLDPPGTPKQIAGAVEYVLEGVSPEGWPVTVHPTPDEVAELVNAGDDFADVAERIAHRAD